MRAKDVIVCRSRTASNRWTCSISSSSSQSLRASYVFFFPCNQSTAVPETLGAFNLSKRPCLQSPYRCTRRWTNNSLSYIEHILTIGNRKTLSMTSTTQLEKHKDNLPCTSKPYHVDHKRCLRNRLSRASFNSRFFCANYFVHTIQGGTP